VKLGVVGLFVNDVEYAKNFYCKTLGFEVKTFIEKFNFVTVVSEDCEVELLLEPNDNPIAKDYQEKLYAAKIPAISFIVDNIYEFQNNFEDKLDFLMEPFEVEDSIITCFDDTCGNYIQIYERKAFD